MSSIIQQKSKWNASMEHMYLQKKKKNQNWGENELNNVMVACRPPTHNGLLTFSTIEWWCHVHSQPRLPPERYNKEQMCERPIIVAVNVTLRFCCPEELDLWKMLNQRCMWSVPMCLTSKPHDYIKSIWRWGMLFKTCKKQKNHRKTQGTAHMHNWAHTQKKQTLTCRQITPERTQF